MRMASSSVSNGIATSTGPNTSSSAVAATSSDVVLKTVVTPPRRERASVQRGSSQEGGEEFPGDLRRHDVGGCKLFVGVALRVVVDTLPDELWFWLVPPRQGLAEVLRHQ